MSKILTKLGIVTDNDKMLMSLSFVLFIPILLDFIAGFTSGQSSNITMIVYGVTFIFIFIQGWSRISINNIFTVLLLYFICFLNAVIFPNSVDYVGIPQYLILLFYLPLGFVLFRTIKSWSSFINILFVFAPFAILIGIYILFFTSVTTLDRSETYITYMEFSYALLPFVCASYAYCHSKKRIGGLIMYIVGIAEMLSFGCRGALVCALFFAILLSFGISSQRKWMFITLLLIVVIAAFNLDSIFGFLSRFSLFEDSYVLRKALEGDVFQHESRNEILLNCENRLSSMGIKISGLFGDRPYCGSVYPHNIIYEILMQWGWILGSFLLLLLAIVFVKGYMRDSVSRMVTIFFGCAALGRFFVSDSYLNNGLFWIMIACMLSVISTKDKRMVNGKGND